MSNPHPATLSSRGLLADCDVSFLRRSGPGGQNRNKVETAVILTHRPTGLAAEANEKRTQGENREAALFRLRLLLALKIRSVPGSGSPSPLWQSRCKGGKLSINSGHDDFPAVLAEALDSLEFHGFDVPKAAESLGITSSQLARFVQQEPRAFLALNDRRKALGLHPLK